MTRPGDRPSPPKPAVIDIAAAVLVFGGMFGLSQLVGGDFLITGSLPAKVPIVGVAFLLDLASVILGFAIRAGRFWLPALNLAGLFAILYLVAMARPIHIVLGLVHVLAFAILLVHRRWFAAVSRGAAPPRA